MLQHLQEISDTIKFPCARATETTANRNCKKNPCTRVLKKEYTCEREQYLCSVVTFLQAQPFLASFSLPAEIPRKENPRWLPSARSKNSMFRESYRTNDDGRNRLEFLIPADARYSSSDCGTEWHSTRTTPRRIHPTPLHVFPESCTDGEVTHRQQEDRPPTPAIQVSNPWWKWVSQCTNTSFTNFAEMILFTSLTDAALCHTHNVGSRRR